MISNIKSHWDIFNPSNQALQKKQCLGINSLSKLYARKCPFQDLCSLCNEWKIQNCCLFLRCFLEKHQLDFVDSVCVSCTSWEDCIRIRKYRQSITPRLEQNLLNVSKASKCLIAIQSKTRFLPRIDLGSRPKIETQLKILNQAHVDCLIVGLENKIYRGKFKRLTFAGEEWPLPLHKCIPFEGKIILATNIRDEYCHLSFQDPDHYLSMLETLQPDAVTTADGAFQYTKPLFVLEDQLNKVFVLNNHLAKSNLPLIGLLQPYVPFIPLTLKHFTAMGLKVLALPAQEMSKSRSSDPYAMEYLREINQCLFNTKYKDSFQYIGLSMSPSSKLAFDYCSSLSWRFVQESDKEKKLILQLQKLCKYEDAARIQAANANSRRKSQNLKKLFGDLNGFK